MHLELFLTVTRDGLSSRACVFSHREHLGLGNMEKKKKEEKGAYSSCCRIDLQWEMVMMKLLACGLFGHYGLLMPI